MSLEESIHRYMPIDHYDDLRIAKSVYVPENNISIINDSLFRI